MFTSEIPKKLEGSERLRGNVFEEMGQKPDWQVGGLDGLVKVFDEATGRGG